MGFYHWEGKTFLCIAVNAERCGAELGPTTTRVLSQLAVGSKECGSPCHGGVRQQRGHVELITYLQLRVGHGGQSCHVVWEVAGVAHVWLSVWRLVVGPHGQTLRDERQEEETEGGGRDHRPIMQVLRATEDMMGETVNNNCRWRETTICFARQPQAARWLHERFVSCWAVFMKLSHPHKCLQKQQDVLHQPAPAGLKICVKVVTWSKQSRPSKGRQDADVCM